MTTAINHPHHWVCHTCGHTIEPTEPRPDGTIGPDPVIAHSRLDDGHRLTWEPRELRVGDIVSVRHIGNLKAGPITHVGRTHIKVAVDRWLDDPGHKTETRKLIAEARFLKAGAEA